VHSFFFPGYSRAASTTALKERRKEIDKLDSYIYGAGTKEKRREKKKRGLRE
jgi:hypothetical protein